MTVYKVFLVLLPILPLGCRGKTRGTGIVEIVENKNEVTSTLQNFIHLQDSYIDPGVKLGAGLNHFFPFDKQPRSFATCLDSTPKNTSPASTLQAKIFLSFSNSTDEDYEKVNQKIRESISFEAKYSFASMSIDSITTRLNNVAKEAKENKSDVEVVFEARRQFKRVSLENIVLKPDAMTDIGNNPAKFYQKCGTGAVLSLSKEVYFKAKAACTKQDTFSKVDTLRELETSLDVKMAAKDVYEVGGALGLASNLSEVLKTLNKRGIHKCTWEINYAGIPTLQGGADLIDTDNLIKTAQTGLDLVLQAPFDEAVIVDAEVQPYSQLTMPIEYDNFFINYSKSLSKTTNRIKSMQDMVSKQLDYLIPIARGTGIDPTEEYLQKDLEGLKLVLEAMDLSRNNPVPNRFHY